MQTILAPKEVGVYKNYGFRLHRFCYAHLDIKLSFSPLKMFEMADLSFIASSYCNYIFKIAFGYGRGHKLWVLAVGLALDLEV